MPRACAISQRAPGRRPGRPVVPLLALLSAGALAGEGADESFVRVTCRGVHELVPAVATAECVESGVLSGPAGLVLPHGTRARAALERGRLEVEASGGSIRGGASAPREASALFRTRIRLLGEGLAGRELRIALELRYAFTGYGGAGVQALLRTSTTAAPSEGDRIRIRLEHRGLRGVRLATMEQRGRTAGPAQGAHPRSGTVTVSSVVVLSEGASELFLRGDLTAHSLGNLGALEPVSSATARASALLVLHAPCALRAVADDGRTLVPGSEPETAPDEAARASCTRALQLTGSAVYPEVDRQLGDRRIDDREDAPSR